MDNLHAVPRGYRWRSSKYFVIFTVALALFGETFLYGFLVPILGYMLENRLNFNPSRTQELTSIVLSTYGAIAVIAGPFIGHFADKVSNKKRLLLLSLIGCMVGTVLIAIARSLFLILVGRVLQSFAGSAVWILGLATVADAVGEEQMGVVMGTMSSFINFGLMSGPAASGILLEAIGYWMTWSVPVTILTVDLISRLLMIQEPPNAALKPEEESTETDHLFSGSADLQSDSSTWSFWRIMLCDMSVIVVLVIAVASPMIGTSFHATLPVHVQEAFGWNSSMIGILFSYLVLPGILIGPFAGWIRDRYGTKIPAVVSLLLQAIVWALLGIAGSPRFPLINVYDNGKTLYTASIIATGALRPFAANIGAVELSGIVKAYQKETPGIFGPNGGLSRAFSAADIAASLGMALGPLIGGFLSEKMSYNFMCGTWSIFYLFLAVLVVWFLGGGKSQNDSGTGEL